MAMELKNKVIQSVEAGLDRILHILVDKTGLPESQLHNRVLNYQLAVAETVNKFVQKEEAFYEELLQANLQMTKDLHVLRKELQVEEVSCIGMVDHMSPYGLNELLTEELRRLSDSKAQKMSQVQQWITEDRQLCDLLDAKAFYISTIDQLPSDQQISELKASIASKKLLLAERTAQFQKQKTDIMAMYEETGTEPASSFDRQVVVSGEEICCKLTEYNMTAVRHLHARLSQLRQQNLEKSGHLRKALTHLATRLRVLDQYPMDSLQGHTMAVIERLQDMLAELEQLKKNKMGELVAACRTELKEWGKRCYYSDIQMEKFLPLFQSPMDDLLLEKHEQELAKIKQYYHDHADLFSLVDECMWLWSTRLKLANTKDSSRLGDYKRLAQEERDRKRVNIRMPKVEQQILQAIQECRRLHGHDFLVHGQPFADFWQNQKECHLQQLEQERRQRKIKKYLGDPVSLSRSASSVSRITLKRGPEESAESAKQNKKPCMTSSKPMQLRRQNAIHPDRCPSRLPKAMNKSSSSSCSATGWSFSSSTRCETFDFASFQSGNLISSTLAAVPELDPGQSHTDLSCATGARAGCQMPSKLPIRMNQNMLSVVDMAPELKISGSFLSSSKRPLSTVNGNPMSHGKSRRDLLQLY